MDVLIFIVDVLECLGVAGGAYFAYKEWVGTKKIRNAKMLLEFSNAFENNPTIKEFFQKIDYGKKWYNKKRFRHSAFEKTADYALSTLCHYVKMIEDGVINEKDFYSLCYILHRTLENNGVQEYFKSLLEFTKQYGIAFPFEPLLRYGREHRLLNDNFN